MAITSSAVEDAQDPEFTKSTLQGFSAGNPTAIDFGPDGRAYVSTQGGTVYALDVTRNDENDYQVVNEVQIDAIEDIPNHDDKGNYDPGRNDRLVTGITAGGTASRPIVYVSSSDPRLARGAGDRSADDLDTNSGTVSRLTITPGGDETIQTDEIDHDVLVLGLPRAGGNHATNGLDLSADGDTLYVAQGGNTNQGAPHELMGHVSEYALGAAVLEVDLQQINENFTQKNFQDYETQGSSQSYPDLEFLYAIPTIQTDDSTDGDDLPFGGNEGINQAKLVEGGPVQIYSPGYRNPYDLVVAESGQLYATDHGPNQGYGGQPADASGDITADASSVTNHPNGEGTFTTSSQLVRLGKGVYGGHPAPIRANPTAADIYNTDDEIIFDITSSNSPVPPSMVNPVEADYIPPTSESPDPGAPAGSANTLERTNGQPVLFGPPGAIDEYTASNFGGAARGDLLQVELSGDITRVEMNAAGDVVTNVEEIGDTNGPLGLATVGNSGPFPGTFWTANRGGNDITVFEPVDYDSEGVGDPCAGDDDASLDEDGDGYDNADEIDAGTNPCSAASTPADFDGDGTSNLNDDDDDNDGATDEVDPFALDPNNGTTTTLPVEHDFAELSLFGDTGQGWTGLMTNGRDDYRDLYDPTKMTVGGTPEVLSIDEVPQGDARADRNTQKYAFQFGVNPPDEQFVVESTVASFPENPKPVQSAGVFVGTGDQSNYAKLVVSADGGTGGVEFVQEVNDSVTHQTSPEVVSDSAVGGSDTTLYLTVDPTTDPAPSNGEEEASLTAAYEVDGATNAVGTAAIPADWLDTSDGTGLAVGVISTSDGGESTFPATWTDISVDSDSDDDNSTPRADAGADRTVDEGTVVSLDGSDSADPNGDDLRYTWSQTGGTGVSLSDPTDEQPTFEAPNVSSNQTLSFSVEVSDGTVSDSDLVNVSIRNTNTSGPVDVAPTASLALSPAEPGVGQAVTLDASDSEDPDGSISSYEWTIVPNTTLLETSFESGSLSAAGWSHVPDSGSAGAGVSDATANSGAQSAFHQGGAGSLVGPSVDASGAQSVTVEYWIQKGADSFSENPDADDPEDLIVEYYSADGTWTEVDRVASTVAPGEEFTESLTLTAGDALHDDLQLRFRQESADAPDGDFWHVDDVSVTAQSDGSEATTGSGKRLTNVFKQTGDYRLGLTVTDDDGLVDSTSTTVTVQAQTDTAPGALLAVTPDSGVGASTTTSGALQVRNAGGQEIDSVTIDLRTTALPGVVFDPQGTAGDGANKGLSVDSQSGDGVGVVSTADGDVFGRPHNGQNGSEGYDVLTVEFGDFEPGETVAFSVDSDPTSVRSVGSQSESRESGRISGLELARATVTVDYANGQVQTTQTFGDGSDGGAVAVADTTVPSSPSLSVDGVNLNQSALDARHGAAAVSKADQTVFVSGPSGAEVTLVRIEGGPQPDSVPDLGEDVEQFGANNAADVEYYSATLDQFGEATIPVTLTESTEVGGLNYMIAALEDTDGPGIGSNVAVLKLETNEAPTIDAIADQTVAEGDPATVPVGASDPDSGDSASLSLSQSPDFVTLSNGNISIDPTPGDATDSPYTVTVTAEDGEGGTATASFALAVTDPASEPPVAAFAVSPAEPRVGQQVRFDASDSEDPDGSVSGYEWTIAPNATLLETSFESGSLSAAGWSHAPESASAGAGVSDATANAGNQSAFHQGGAGSLVSPAVDANGTQSVTVEYWIQKGVDSLSENPDSSAPDDLIVEYYSADGTWVEIDRTGSTMVTGAAVTERLTLTAGDALHDGLRLRFRQEGADAPNGDFWHVDNVSVTAQSSGDETITGSGEALTSTFQTAGDYDVSLTVTDDDGATDTTTRQVNVSTAMRTDLAVSLTDDGTLSVGETTTVEIAVVDAAGGVGAGEFGIELETPSVASITDVTVQHDPGRRNSTVAASSARADVVYAFADSPDAGPVTVVEATVRAKAAGSTKLSVGQRAQTGLLSLFNENGMAYTLGTVGNVTLTVNTPPEADAGENRTVEEGTTVTLDASDSSDPDSDALDYTWTQTDGPSVSLQDSESPSTVFAAPDVTGERTLVFEVAVSDGQTTDADTVVVTVDPGLKPIADFENPPTDPDGDGKFEDINGDGKMNVGDVQAAFANAQDPVAQNNPEAFDFNGDGSVNVADAQTLFANGIDA